MKTKALIVDDDVNSLYFLETLLKGYGAEVVVARNGKEALEKAIFDPPDIIISDILMPSMDGFTFCRMCKTHSVLKNIPFVFYTATYTDKKDEEFSLQLGADRFLIKPQEPDVLIEVITNLLSEREKVSSRPSVLGEEMEFFKKYNEALFRKLEKKMLDLELALQEQKIMDERYRLCFANVADVIIAFDRYGIISFITPSMKRILGYEADDFVGRDIFYLGKIFAPECLKEALEDFKAVMRGEILGPKIYQFLDVRGNRKYGEVNSSLMTAQGQVSGLICIARDVTERIETEKKLEEANRNLNRAMKSTIEVIISAVESRDPYTAGHQLRVAHLAQHIALKMGLPPEKVEALHMASLIHDIGKLAIPIDILVKPSKLSELEFQLVQEHVYAGYKIASRIEAPWPLAEIIYQHHERMDGSGYPRHLKKDQICIEARILGVADVVEAMTSHRPYRPAWDLEVALKELELNKGSLYDPDVVEVCLKLFREDGYQLLRPLG